MKYSIYAKFSPTLLSNSLKFSFQHDYLVLYFYLAQVLYSDLGKLEFITWKEQHNRIFFGSIIPFKVCIRSYWKKIVRKTKMRILKSSTCNKIECKIMIQVSVFSREKFAKLSHQRCNKVKRVAIKWKIIVKKPTASQFLLSFCVTYV